MVSLIIVDLLVFLIKTLRGFLSGINCNFVCQIVWSSVASSHNSHVSFCCPFTAAPCPHAVVTYAGLVEGYRYDLLTQTTGQPAITTRDCQGKKGQANLRDYTYRVL